MSIEIMRKVDAILDSADVPERHTYFQLKHFIVGKEPTLAGQLWQVVRELRARRESLEALQEQIDEIEDNIKLATVKLERLRARCPNHEDKLDVLDYEATLSKVERENRSLYRTRANLERKMAYLSQEIIYLLGAFETLSKAEPLKPLDDFTAQAQYWNEKFTEELNLRILLGQSVDPDFVRTVMCLDGNLPVKQQMTAILQKIQDHAIADRDRQQVTQNQIGSE